MTDETLMNKTIGKRTDGRLNVAVLMGGASSEREVSLATGAEIVRALNKAKYCVKSIDTADLPSMFLSAGSGGRVPPPGGLPEAPEPDVASTSPNRDIAGNDGFLGRPDVVFIALHGKGGEDGSIQGLLELLGLPYTGSGVLASALAMNKTMSKRLFASSGIPVIPGITVSRSKWRGDERAAILSEIGDSIGWPVFVKPNAEGSTFGCTLVEDEALLEPAIDIALTYDTDALVERYIRGTEVTIGILEEPGGQLRSLPAVEIVPKSSYYDYESKYAAGGSEHIIPARIDEGLTALASEYAVKCHTVLGCRGVSRTDMIVSDGTVYVLEVNTIPGMTPTSLLPQAAAHASFSFPILLDRILDSALARNGT
jgi:D-alanine-D-alanine ligase